MLGTKTLRIETRIKSLRGLILPKVSGTETDPKVSGTETHATILEWAAREGRVLLTHDVFTITRYAYERIRAGQEMPGVFAVSREIPIAVVIEDILLLTDYSLEREWEGQIRYLPLR